MTEVVDTRTCPSCGSNAVLAEWRALDPKTGKPTKTPLMTILLSSLLAVASVFWLLVVVAQLIEPTPGVGFGTLDLFLTIASIGAIANFLGMLRGGRSRRQKKSLFCWCRACANEWIGTGQPTAKTSWADWSPQAPVYIAQPVTDPNAAIATPASALSPISASAAPVAPLPAPAVLAAGAAPADGSGLRWMMESLKSMPLPEKLRGWNQVISIGFKDRPALWYRWVINGDQWQVGEGQTSRPTLRLMADTEDGLAKRFAIGYTGAVGYSLLLPSSLSAGPGSNIKCNALVMDITRYLQSSQAPTLAEWQAARMNKKYGIGDSTPVPKLIEALGATDVDARKAAADTLEKSGWTPPPEKAEAYWAAKRDWNKAWAAAAAASSPGALSDVNAAIEYLSGYLKRKDIKKSPAVIHSIVAALVELGPSAMPGIYVRYTHPTLDTTYQLNLLAAMMGIFRLPNPVELRIEFLKYPLKPVHGDLKNELASAGSNVVEPLIAVLHDQSVELRRSAAEVLGRIGDPRALGPLEELSNDSSRFVRTAATDALAKIRVRPATPA